MGVEVCPIHRSEFKNSTRPNVADMNEVEFKGVKRSAEDDEDENPRQRPLTFNEKKRYYNMAVRKRDVTLNPRLSLRDQTILNCFICSVRLDMERDGIRPELLYDEDNNRRRGIIVSDWRHPRTNSPTFDLSSNNYINNLSDVDSRPGSPSVINAASRGIDNNESDFSSEYERCFMDPDSFKATPFPRTSYDRVDNSALWTDENDRFSRLNWCSVLNTSLNGSDNSTSDYISESDDSSSNNLHTLMPAAIEMEYFDLPSSAHLSSDCPSGNTSPPSGTSPTSSEDEIFSDIDVNLYDFDYHAMSPPSVAIETLAIETAEELELSLSNDQRRINPSERDFVASVST